MTTPHPPSTDRPAGPRRDDHRVAAFVGAQARALQRYGVTAESRFVEVPAVGRGHVLVAGDGPPLVLVIGGTVPAVFWAPLMAHLPGRTLYAMDLPGFGLTDPVAYEPGTYRRTAVGFLAGVLDALGLERADFVTHSMGSLWTHWLAGSRPGRVAAQTMIGCPAFFLGTSAPVPMRLASVPGLGRLLLSAPPSAGQVARVMAMVGERPDGIDEVCGALLACERLPGYTGSMLGMMRSVMSWTRARPEVRTGPDELRAVRRPVQLIWGEHDAFGSVAAGRRIAELVPGARCHVVPGGHAPWFHHAERVAPLARDFLEARGQRP